MNGKTTNDLQLQYKKMNEYNFNKPYKVSMSFEETDHKVEHSYRGHIRKRNSECTNICDYIKNPRKNQSLDNSNEKILANNTLVSPEGNVNAKSDKAQMNPTAQLTELTQHRILNLQPSAVCNRLTSSSNRIPEIKNTFNDLNMLSNNIINILKAFVYYTDCFKNCGENVSQRKLYSMTYLRTKLYYINASRDILIRSIFPQGNNFNEINFLRKTMNIAYQREKLIYTFENVETVYRDIISSYYKQISNDKAVQNCDPRNRINNGQFVSPHKDVRRDPYVTQKNNNKPESTMNLSPPSYYCPNNIIQSIHYRHPPDPKDYSITDGNYNNATKQIIDNGLNPILQPSYQNNHQTTHVIQTVDRTYHFPFEQRFEDNRNCYNRQENPSNQHVLGVPTTCVFQYRNSDCEVRLDVNTQILNDINKNNQCNKNLLINNFTHLNNQNTDNVTQPEQSTDIVNTDAIMPYQDLQFIQPEPIRSTSRDSGFMSPCNNQMNDLCNVKDGQESTSPYITHVTSLNPDVLHIPMGACQVCGELTKKKCLGCYKYYYCSHECQKQHWSAHKYECMNNT